MRLRVGFVAALFCCFLLYPRCGYGSGEQSASLRTSVATSGSNTRYPDQGFLSNYRYANAFFGFTKTNPGKSATQLALMTLFGFIVAIVAFQWALS